MAAVDASQATIDGVIAGLEAGEPPPLLLVHHGLLWEGNVPLTGRRYRRVAALLDHDIPLYSAHIPLDVHPEVGNNAVLAERLGIRVDGRFGDIVASLSGYGARARASLPTREAVALELDRVLHTLKGSSLLMSGGPERPARIGIITGGGGNMISYAQGCRDWIPTSLGKGRITPTSMPWNGASTSSMPATTPPKRSASRQWLLIWRNSSIWSGTFTTIRPAYKR